jgi:hypothetical protein
MNAMGAVAAHPSPAPAFTLATALGWLGHQCVSHCSSSLDDLPASIWFVRRRSPAQPRHTIIVVDLTNVGGSVAWTRRRVHDINRCTRGDSIHVFGRRMADIGNALRIVTRESNSGAHPRINYQ